MFTIYILYSHSLSKFYIGFTGDDVNIRLSKHLATHKGFTAKAKDWEVVYSEIYETRQEAMKREKQLKGWKSNIRIKELIARASTQQSIPTISRECFDTECLLCLRLNIFYHKIKLHFL